MFDVITFGSATIDMFAETGLAEKGKFMAYPVGDKILLKDLKFSVGGGGTNTAVAFSRLGFKTGFIGKIDNSFGGKNILELLKKEKVKFLGAVEKNSDSSGGYSIILDSKEKDRTVLTYKGISDSLKFDEIKIKKIKTKWAYLSSSLGKSLETQKRVAKIFHENGVKIAFNPSSYLIKKENIAEILKLTDILILNKEEAKLLTKENNLLAGLKKLGPKIVVITNDKETVYAYDGKKNYSISPRKIKVVEKTGAGDAFASGFVAGQIVGRSIDESLKLGLDESEAVIKHFGAKNNLLRRKLK